MTDRATGSGRSVTVWRTEAGLLASEANGYCREPLAKIAAYLVAPTTRAVYEKLGLATEAEVDIGTLEKRLRDEALAANINMPIFALLGQWARKP